MRCSRVCRIIDGPNGNDIDCNSCCFAHQFQATDFGGYEILCFETTGLREGVFVSLF